MRLLTRALLLVLLCARLIDIVPCEPSFDSYERNYERNHIDNVTFRY